MIMKKISLFAAIMAGLLAVGCVQKEDVAPAQAEGNKIMLTIQADYPSSPDTKVAFGEGEEPELVWTGNETMSVLIGRTGTKENPTTSKATGLQVTLNSIAPGIFSGEVDLGEFAIDDIQAVAVPAEIGAFYSWNSSADRVMIPLATAQTQTVNGVFNPAYVPFMAKCTSDSLSVDAASGIYKVSGLQLSTGTDLVQFNVYGKNKYMQDNEVLKSVKITTNNRITGEVRWNIGSTGAPGSNSSGPKYVQVNYEGTETIADKTNENGIKVFASVVCGGSRPISEVEIVTDKATYVKSINKSLSTKNLTKLAVYRVALDLSTFARVGSGLSYSVNGGENWLTEIPSVLNGSLAVKTDEGCLIASENLSEIKAVIDAQTAPVALDMSQAQYEATAFPAVFAGTADAPNTTLKSIEFPSNVTEVVASAFIYCSALEAVNLDKITTLGKQAFRYSGLKSVRVDKQVTSISTHVFADCYDLESAYFNATDSGLADIGSNDNNPNNNYNVFMFAKSGMEHTTDFTLTIGPDSRLPRYCLQNNNNVVKIIFEYSGTKDRKFGNNALVRANYIHTIICKGTTDPGLPYANIDVTQLSQNVPDTVTKYFVVPDGCSELYKNHNTPEEASAGNYGLYTYLVQNAGFTLIEQSAYDALQAGDQN